MNTYLKSHIQSIKGNLHVEKKEYDVLKDQVVRKLRSMKVAHAETYRVSNIKCTYM